MSKTFSESHSQTENNSDKRSKIDDDVLSNADSNASSKKLNKKSVYSKKSNVQQLLARIAQEIDEREPSNVIHFIVDFLCKHYPEHLHGFESIWNGDPDLEQDRLLVVEFFKYQKLPVEISVHFINAGFDTVETLCTLSANSLDDVEKFSNTRWLPGHKVRLQQTFNDITNRVRRFKEERDSLIKSLRQGYISPSPIHSSSILPKSINPMMAPVISRVSSPINISTRTGNYVRVNEPVSSCFFKR
ncbi:stripes inner membrane complex protein, putative [Plasmodium gallinaceum]|uniref:Stripes inner membrane complex protein, putative n=1 Tax=Plasmodium gallinaceum TaxID=5849 RepID=A0A1J1GZH9_PLAGA|nr:stripes inner membrane complex protein, putative [Plasmodium gallinaceum]CRG97879.1 stripes inner membrane complex protein, putative [Plasmodium gallinaceum]